MKTAAKILAHLLLWGMPLFGVFLYFHPYWDLEGLTHSFSLAMIAGILAYGFILQQFILGSRVGWLDRLFGQDRVIRLHGFLGVLSLVFIMAHVMLKNMNTYTPNTQVALGLGASFLFNTIILLSAFFMSPILIAKWKPLAAIRRWTAQKLRLQYQHLRTVHNLVALAAALVAAHVYLASSTSENWIRRGYMGLWFLLAIGVYLYHKVIKPWRLRTRPFTVESVMTEAPGITTVILKAPQDRPWTHKAGQFAFFRFFQKGVGREEHPFTVSSAPNTTSLSITAKDLGDFSGNLSKVLPGAHVAVDGPYGLFQLPKKADGRPIVFLAGGIGITPFLSMLRSLKTAAWPGPITLVWNTKTAAELFAKEELDRLASQLPAFSWIAFVSREEAPGARRGRLDGESLEGLGFPSDACYYLCGPDGQMDALVRALLKKGVKSKNLHFERFAF